MHPLPETALGKTGCAAVHPAKKPSNAKDAEHAED